VHEAHPADAAAGQGNSWSKGSSTSLRFNSRVACLTSRMQEKYVERLSCKLSKPSLTKEKQTGKVTGKFKESTDASRVK